MIYGIMNFVQGVVQFSILGCIEIGSLAYIVYYLYAKTRIPAIIANVFPNLNLNINYWTPLNKLSNMGNDLISSLRPSNSESETRSLNALNYGIGTRNILELTSHTGRKPYKSLFDSGIYFPYIVQQLRCKSFNYPQIAHLVEKDPLLQRAVKQAAEQAVCDETNLIPQYKTNSVEDNDIVNYTNTMFDHKQYQNILRAHERRAIKVIQKMHSNLNNFLLKLTSWLLYKLLPCFLSGVISHTKQIDMIKSAAEQNPGVPLIFLPLHRSHLDYILVTFILLNNNIRCPLVAAGNNLQIPVFGGLLRGLGAFFIKRKIDPIAGKKDIVYRAVLQLYLQHALKMGHNLEFFIEGGRTRTGKPCMPKGGILSVIVNAFMDGSIQDALLVPVSVNYERLVDGNFTLEQRGEKKIPESFAKALVGIWKTLNSKYGLMRIDFNQPYSIRELVNSYNKIVQDESAMNHNNLRIKNRNVDRKLQHNQSTSSLYGTDVVCEEHRNLIDSISRQVVYDCAIATSVMTTNALAFLLLTRFRKGGEPIEIAKALDALRSDLNQRKDIGFSGDSLNVVNYACDILGNDLIEHTTLNGKQVIRPVNKIDSFIELSYYSNLLTPHYALKCILLTTFHRLLHSDLKQKQDILKIKPELGTIRRKLVQTAMENCEVFRYEFILEKPTQNLENLLEDTIDDLIIGGYIRCKQTADSKNSDLYNRITKNILQDEYESDDHIMTVHVKDDIFFSDEKSIEDHKAMCEILAPFGFSYLAVAKCLWLLDQNPMLESEFIKVVINDITNKVKNDVCHYAESVSTDSVRNCLKLMEKWSVIEIRNYHGYRILSLRTEFENSKSLLKSIITKIDAVVPNYKNCYFESIQN